MVDQQIVKLKFQSTNFQLSILIYNTRARYYSRFVIGGDCPRDRRELQALERTTTDLLIEHNRPVRTTTVFFISVPRVWLNAGWQ